MHERGMNPAEASKSRDDVGFAANSGQPAAGGRIIRNEEQGVGRLRKRFRHAVNDAPLGDALQPFRCPTVSRRLPSREHDASAWRSHGR
jgi:hypothetical protein